MVRKKVKEDKVVCSNILFFRSFVLRLAFVGASFVVVFVYACRDSPQFLFLVFSKEKKRWKSGKKRALLSWYSPL